jgi:DNA-binding GntR family transcriptional regulator
MERSIEIKERRTSADVVFDYLYEKIGSLELLPGAKISEAEIAAKFNISRQPVRDAFSRLGNIDLLLIRPQKATLVKKFSLQSIETARFVRLSVEMEVLRQAAQKWDGSAEPELRSNLEQQRATFEAADVDRFHTLDYEFHRLLSRAADAEFAFEIIAQNKARVDRLCVLSLTAQDGMRQLIEDHATLIAQLADGDETGVAQTIRTHLSRLDGTIGDIHRTHASYFE